MKKSLLILLFALSATLTMNGITRFRGDLNGDEELNVTDVTMLTNVVLGGGATDATLKTLSDVNGDGVINVSDVTALITKVLNGEELPFDGYSYVWDYDSPLAELHLSVSREEWNRLLTMFDANNHTKQYVMGRARYLRNGDVTEIDSIGLRLRGNTSRRRPEGREGRMHDADNTDWHHVHFGINLRKYVKSENQTILGVRKFNLKWFKDDPMYCREVFCYDLFRRYGVWTASDDVYCRLWLKIDGDKEETYFGVYEMIEPVDENYLKRRQYPEHFGTAKGNLWKCEQAAASLSNTNADFWYDDDTDADHVYTLQTNTKRFENGKAQLVDFMLKLNGKSDDSFYKWIKEVCDVDLLLKTYAVIVAVGSWDDYWNNANNYYLYFTTEDIYNYKVYLLPFDYDNTLGTSLRCGVQSDAGRQNPLQWGGDGNPLIKRILAFNEFRTKYIAYLKELVGERNGLMHYTDSRARIEAWHDRIRDFISNDTGEDMEIRDEPAYWGNHSEYRLLQDGQNNFFRVKANVVNSLR